MKRTSSLILAFILLLVLIPSASSVAETEGDFSYSVSDGKATITGYLGTASALTIPSSIGEYPVVAIGNDVFWNNSSLTSVTIPEGITDIGEYAFCNCTSLASVSLPNSLKTIGAQAFCACEALMTVSLPAGITSVGQQAFDYSGWYYAQPNVAIYLSTCFLGWKGDNAPTTYQFTDGTTVIADHTFSSWYNLTDIDIPDSVITIGAYAFYDCTALADVTVPDSVERIVSNAFACCSSIKSITIGSGIKRIDGRAFINCTALKTVFFFGSCPSVFGEAVFDQDSAVSPKLDCTLYYLPEYAESWSPDKEIVWNGYSIHMYGAVNLTKDSETADYAVIERNDETRILSNICAGTKVDELAYAYAVPVTGPDIALKTGDTVTIEDIEYTVAVSGDVDCNGEITASDASKLLRSIVRLEMLTSIQGKAANLHGGESCTAADASNILRWIVKLDKYLCNIQ